MPHELLYTLSGGKAVSGHPRIHHSKTTVMHFTTGLTTHNMQHADTYADSTLGVRAKSTAQGWT